ANGEVGREAVPLAEVVVALAVDADVAGRPNLAAHGEGVVARGSERLHRGVDSGPLLVGEDHLALDRERLHGVATLTCDACSQTRLPPTAKVRWFPPQPFPTPLS